jgi:hypothetical protein
MRQLQGVVALAMSATSATVTFVARERHQGRVDRSLVRHVKQHELDAANYLADLGHGVEFLPRGDQQSADFRIDDADVWELKSPASPIRNTVMRRIAKGRGQSANIILDLARTSIPTEDARALAENIVGRYVDISRIWLIGRIEAGQPLNEIVGEEAPDAER